MKIQRSVKKLHLAPSNRKTSNPAKRAQTHATVPSENKRVLCVRMPTYSFLLTAGQMPL